MFDVEGIIGADESILLKLRDAAKIETDDKKRSEMHRVADSIYDLIKNFGFRSTCQNLARVQSEWGHALRLLANATGQDSPRGAGMKQGAILAA